MRRSVPRISPLTIHDQFVWGWACVPAQHALRIQLLLDGKIIAVELTGQTLPAAVQHVCGKQPQTNAGFRFPLPAAVHDGFPHQLQARLDTEHGGLSTPLLQLPGHPVRGMVHQQGRHLAGTVWFAAAKPRRARLQITDANGKILLTQRLAPLATSEHNGYPAAFSIALARLQAEPLTISCDGQPLRGSPLVPISHVGGNVEQVSVDAITGWVLDFIDVKRPLQVALRIDGNVIDWFHCNQRHHGLAQELSLEAVAIAPAGFHIVPPALLRDGKPHLLEVVEACTGHVLDHGRQHIQWPPDGERFQPSRRKAPGKPPTAVNWPPPQVSVVILNRNGADLLHTLLTSWQLHNRTVPAELIVIDHASTDGSRALLKGWRHQLNLQVIALPRNDSFAASCNLGVRRAKAPYLLFLNNDIELVQDVLPCMLDSLADPAVGVVGLKLLKQFDNANNAKLQYRLVQHLGIRFSLSATIGPGYWPYEIAPVSPGVESEYSPALAPAVTAAALLCRKQDFTDSGGFGEDFFYCFEDVEFCLRLAQRLHKRIVCRNDCTALHHHGHTRLSGREPAVIKRLPDNAGVFQRQLGLWLKRTWWRSLLANDGDYTRETLCIGLVGSARSLAPALAKAHPQADIRVLPVGSENKQTQQCHVLVVGDPHYDLRTLPQARSDTLLVAWITADSALWQQQQWWHDYEAVVAPAAKARALGTHWQLPVHASTSSAPLGRLLNPDHVRVRVQLVIDARDGKSRSHMEQLQRQLRKAGMGCRVVDIDDACGHMADLIIEQGRTKGAKLTARPTHDGLRILWPQRAPAPTAQWLTAELEKQLGSTFRSS